MSAADTLPAWLSDAIATIPWPISALLVFAVGALAVLALVIAWDVFVVDHHFDRIERETQTGRYRPPSEVEAAAPKWHAHVPTSTNNREEDCS